MRVYVCPALMDWLLMLALFAVSYGAGKRGWTVAQQAWLGGACQLAYMFTSLISGFFLSRRNALPILIASTLGAIATGVFSLAAQRFDLALVGLALLGICVALFFNSFQSFMRGESAPGGLMRTTAFYTFAWSAGVAMGEIASGSLFRLGPVALGALTALIGAAILGALLLHRQRPHDLPSAEEHTEPGPAGAPPVAPQYVWAAWIIIFTAMFVQRPILTFYPALCAKNGILPALAALPLFLHYLLQAASGLYTVRLRRLFYRRTPLLVIQLAAAAVLLTLWRFPNYWVTVAGISALGIWGGFMYFCAVYYPSNSGPRARNIGINEFLVGLGSFSSLFVCEWFINLTRSDAVMYAVCGGALVVSAAAQWGVLTWKKQNIGAGR